MPVSRVLSRLGVTRRLLRNPVFRWPVRMLTRRGVIPFELVAGAPIWGLFEARVCGIKFLYDLGARDTLGEALYWQGPAEQETVGCFAGLARQARGFLDAGANTGFYTLLGCALNARLQAIAWEPAPYLNEKLRTNIVQNGFGNRCQARHEALSDYAGQARFFIPALSTTTASFHAGYGNTTDDEEVTVPVVTIDQAIPQDFPVDLVKIDVEGAEDGVLRGMRETILRWRPAIIVECILEGPFAQVDSMLRDWGYQLYHITGRGTVPIDRIAAPDRVWGNYLALYPK